MQRSHADSRIQLPRKIRDELGIPGNQDLNPRRQGQNLAARRREQRKSSRVEKRARYARSSRPIQSAATGSRGSGSESFQPRRNTNKQSKDVSNQENNGHEHSLDGDELAAQGQIQIPRATRHKLADDDAQIAALEKKLGRKRKQSADGMASLFKDLDGLSDDDLADDISERHNDQAEDWLRAKRRKSRQEIETIDEAYRLSTISDNNGGDVFTSDTDAASKSDESAAEEYSSPKESLVPPSKATMRENPYKAPDGRAADVSTKYIPPSRRNTASVGTGVDTQLKRQIKGLVNRLSESNLTEIVKRVSQIYNENARHDVSGALVDHLLDVVTDRTALNDTFIILHAAFVAALQKTVGMEFAAFAVQRLVEAYDEQSERPVGLQEKQALNLVHMLVQLYNFQVIGSTLIYDFIRQYVSGLTENDTEILLKVVRNSGFQLRQDDPAALKEIVSMLHDTVEQRGGEETLNVRTKVMLEIIENLGNNRSKLNNGASSVGTESVIRMKKLLGTLRNLSDLVVRPTEPLRIGLSDIRNSELKGKWWLVGASFRDEAQIRTQAETTETGIGKDTVHKAPTAGAGSEPDMADLAKLFGMNTDIRRALFVNFMTAASIEEARERFIKMRLNKRQMREVPIVLVRCGSAEKTFNQYYADLARSLSTEREIRKSLWNPLLEFLARLEGDDTSDLDDDDPGHNAWWQEPHAQFNTAKLYGSLFAERVVPITILASRDLIHPPTSVRIFLELLLSGMFCKLYRLGKSRADRLEQILKPVASRDDAAMVIPMLSNFVQKAVSRTKLLGHHERKGVAWGCKTALIILDDIQQDETLRAG